MRRRAWPVADPQLTRDEQVTIAIQVNGKLRGTLEVSRDVDNLAVEEAALALPQVLRWLEGRPMVDTAALSKRAGEAMETHEGRLSRALPMFDVHSYVADFAATVHAEDGVGHAPVGHADRAVGHRGYERGPQPMGCGPLPYGTRRRSIRSIRDIRLSG